MSDLLRNAKTVLGRPRMLACYARWCVRPLGLTPRVQLPHGAGCISGFHSFTEYWWGHAMVPDFAELEFYRNFAGSEGVILDVGANLGGHALTLGSLHLRRDVHAFEPSPSTFDALEYNIRFNRTRNVHAHRIAVAHNDGRMRFDADQKSPGTNCLLLDAIAATSPDVVEVEVTTIDSFLEEIGESKVAMLKIDVEGFEVAVLQGAKRALARGDVAAALIELCPGNLARAGYSVEALLQVVRQSGLAMHFLDSKGNPRERVDESAAQEVSLCNVALLRADGIARSP